MAHPAIGFAERAVAAALTRDLGEATIIGAHQMEGSARLGTDKGRHKQCTFAVAEWLFNHAKVVQAEIKPKSERHEVPLTHILIFVPIKSFKPGMVADGEIAIVPRDTLGHCLSAALGGDQFRGATRRERNPIKAWTVK